MDTRGEWKRAWKTTRYPGVRYREHSKDTHGIRPDRYYFIRYRVDGKLKEEGVGRSSNGMTAVKANTIRVGLMENARTGQGPKTLAESRSIQAREREEAEAAEAEAAARRVTFDEFFNGTYLVTCSDKDQQTMRGEQCKYKKWLKEPLGSKPLHDVTSMDLEKVKATMKKKGLAPRTVSYVLAIVRQVFRKAKVAGLFSGDLPTENVKFPKNDNRRLRYLTHAEAEAILKAVKLKSPDLWNICVIALECGLRAGEIFSMEWGDVNLRHGVIGLRDTKNTLTRHAFLTPRTRKIFEELPRGEPGDLIFPSAKGGKRVQVSHAFRRVVDKLGLNKGVTDRRMRICFHTLRHTFASWVKEAGGELFTIKELLGHKSIQMAERYSHIGESTLRQASARAFGDPDGKVVPISEARKKTSSA